MFYIRLFLWGLVAAMTLQGVFHADEYGTAATLVGGVTMTMSVWSESFMASIKGFLSTEAKFIGLPRALCVAAIQESARHPIIKTLPRLKSTLDGHQKVWNAFRDAHVTWSLGHMDLIGGLQTEGSYVWNFWSSLQNVTEVALNATIKDRCLMKSATRSCVGIEERIVALEVQMAAQQRAEAAWTSVLGFYDSGAWHNGERWWTATQNESLTEAFAFFQSRLRTLHNVTEVDDERIVEILESLPISLNVSLDRWLERLLASLLTGDVWAAAMDHVRARETRVRELMIAAGIQELWATHERTLAASMKALAEGDAKRRLVEDWFGEMASYAWWLPDEVPGIVRRCIGQEGGDCSRIGPTEIQSLSAQHMEKNRILEDWTRRVFIGMWNAMPVIALLFLLEIIVLILPQKRVFSFVPTSEPMLEDRVMPNPGPGPRKTTRFLKN